jgi:hypothetical protein
VHAEEKLGSVSCARAEQRPRGAHVELRVRASSWPGALPRTEQPADSGRNWNPDASRPDGSEKALPASERRKGRAENSSRKGKTDLVLLALD